MGQVMAKPMASERSEQETKVALQALTMLCPICGKEFSCNKRYHAYKAYKAKKIKYFCSYSCYKNRASLVVKC